MPHLLLILVPLILLCSCAGSPKKAAGLSARQESHAPTIHEVKSGPFCVLFSAGPVQHLSGGGRRSFSTYQVSYQVEGEVTMTAIAQSAQNLEVFMGSPDNRFEEIIEVFASKSGRTLLIVEDVINDCCPCSNHILITISDEDLKVTYLDMPTWTPPVKGAIPMPIFPEYPKVKHITDDEVEFEYSNKQCRRVGFGAIPRLDGVRFPG